MNSISKKIAELEEYEPPFYGNETEMNEFWEKNLRLIKDKSPALSLKEETVPFPGIKAFKASYKGFDETPLSGWLLLPTESHQEKLPCAVVFHGYTGSKGYPEKHAALLLLGIAVFAADVRGQGGETGNLLPGFYGMSPGFVTQNILNKEQSYFNAISIDAIKTVEAAAQLPQIDAGKLFVMGDSQGGGLALLASALSPYPAFAVANIPNLCHMDFGIMESQGSLKEIAAFLRSQPEKLEEVLEVISHFDLLGLASRIRIPVLMSAGLKDDICLPETIYAVYNIIKAEKKINVFPFGGHETGEYQKRQGLLFIKEQLMRLQ
ncbi:acetylxylan esterase [Metabacillus sp. GX 13764]|uniref:acetylxylan esterase n=1 Tax=Metabacillus kandeliae TaxID=2900151 RepID=UPI001E42D06A|nr:acetylxylan esterase [Metabacillus kandeliae]MCD7033984.1 acetylxylan esterase [Metabacillus kandeliae]